MSREQQASCVINTAALQTEIVPICEMYLRPRLHGTGRIFDRFKICAFRRSVHTEAPSQCKHLDAWPFKVPWEKSANIERSRVNVVSRQIFQSIENSSDQFRFVGNCPPIPPLTQR